MTNPRLIATQMLQEIMTKRLFVSEVKGLLDSQTPQDSSFINMLILTALRHLVFTRSALKQFIKKKLPAESAIAEYALILGATEVFYLQTPDYAVINSYVNLVKEETDKYVGGFTNAVLRKICTSKEDLIAQDKGDFFSKEFFRILDQSYGNKISQKIQKYALLEPSLDLTAKEKPAEIAEELMGALLPLDTIRLENNGKISKLKGFDEGKWWVQDFAAALAVKTLGEIKNLRVLDLCAAPGGKTAQLLSLGAKVTALDISENRLQTLKENLQRLQMQAHEVICADALDYLQNFQGETFDAIVLDAPCSATGTIRRHPELVHIKSLSDVEKQAIIQAKLLQQVGKALKVGGRLVYCVCSLSKIEGEMQIDKFLKENNNFQAISLADFVPQEISEILTPDGYIRTLPQHLANYGGVDGFFIAQLQKMK